MSKTLIGPPERAQRWRALVRLEGRRGDGRAFVEPGEVFEMPVDEAAPYLAAGCVEALDGSSEPGDDYAGGSSPLAGRGE